MEERTRAYRRHKRRCAIQKKRNKITKRYGYKEGYDMFPLDGQLAKGKIHCSCNNCKVKKSNKGWKHSDVRQLIRVYDDYEEYEYQ